MIDFIVYIYIYLNIVKFVESAMVPIEVSCPESSNSLPTDPGIAHDIFRT